MQVAGERFRVVPDEKVDLAKLPTAIDPLYQSKDHYQTLLDGTKEELNSLQEMLYASDRHSLLFIFQAMDAAGKDGVINNVMSGINPQGCQVFSFKAPSAEELDHDFLWRTARCLPERGRIGIFNRSYYEEVLVVRVHPEILQNERLPKELADDKLIWKQRYQSINEWELHLHRNGTRVVKFFLHLSKEEQRNRFLARIDEPDKNWKFNAGDVKERQYWEQYMQAYESCLRATSSEHAPWYVVPADDKKNARLIVAGIVVDTLRGLKLSYPPVDAARRKELLALRAQLVAESD
ncbi:MAG: polyphosphate kinase 2 family protein [Candidatus Obscuribacterales bacterium]|nr:polyphosphate kinase 2 family protein [Steroidobacteraceae bacterium]